MIVALHKPYGMLSQFTPEPGSAWRTLADLHLPPNIYPLGRLDADSEGLLLLSDEPGLNTRLLDPKQGHSREYWALVERIPDADALQRLQTGVMIGGYRTRPSRARILDPQPQVPPRDPPVRYRKNVPDTWISLELEEGKNRQVRRMTAAVGHPTLRLIRVRIGRLNLLDLQLNPGQWKQLGPTERNSIFG